MIVHNFDPILVDLGWFQIKWYSIAYIGGIILGWMYAIKIINKSINNNSEFLTVKKSDFDELIIYLILGIIIGGRLGYVFFYNFSYYSLNFFEIFKIWQGGMAFHGGLIGVIFATYIFAKIKNNNFFKLSDIIACVAPIGLFLGRIANFINGELVGKVSNLPWAVVFSLEENVGRHPSQIYEAILEGIVLFILINFFAFKKKFIFKPGYISGLFLIFYSILRIFSEIFREPDINLGYFFSYFSMGTLLSILSFFFGVLILFYIKNNEQNN